MALNDLFYLPAYILLIFTMESPQLYHSISLSFSLSLNSFVWDEWKSIYLSLSRLFSRGSGLISLWTVSDIWVFDIEAFVHFCVCGC